MRPSRISLLNRFFFDADQFEPWRRGVNFWAYFASFIRLTMLSIQPKQRASSTAWSYGTRGRPVCCL